MNTVRKQLCVFQIMFVSVLATGASAGNLTVAGNSTVASNLTIQTATVGTAGTFTWGQYSASDVGQGIYLQRSGGYLNSTLGWGPTKAAIQAYSDSNKTPTELSLNVNGGQVSIDMIYGSDGFDVATNAVFYGNLTVNGKITTPYPVDPPCLLLDSQTRTGIAQQVALGVPPDKQGGAAVFFNQATKRVEIYVAAESTFYDLAGNAITNLPQPVVQVTVGRRIWFDPVTGNVVTNQTLTPYRYQIRPGYQFDPADGQFYQVSSSAGSNTVPRVLVPKSQAIVLTQ